MKHLKYLILSFMVMVFFISELRADTAIKKKELIRIASIDWCPQLCPNSKDRGYIFDLVQLVFKDTIYELSIETMPWSRAIKMTKDGSAIALLSPAKAEAPDMIYPDTAVGTQSMCFFTLASSTWKYAGEASLKGLRIGIANDTSVDNLNDYVKANSEQFQFQPYSDKYIISNLRKLERKRIDTFLFTKNTTLYEIDKIGWSEKFKLAGCVSKENIYVAFSPALHAREKVNYLKNIYEKKMKSYAKDGTIKQVMDKYGL